MSGGIAPQKFEHADVEDVARFIYDDRWVLEQKMDGARAMFVFDGTATDPRLVRQWLNSSGQPLTFAAARQHLTAIGDHLVAMLVVRGITEAVIDGEIIPETGIFHVFDVPSLYVNDRPVVRIFDGYLARRRLAEGFLHDTLRVEFVPIAVTTHEKATLWERIVEQGVEGAVAKELDAPYRYGVRVSTQQKLKLVKTADVVVLGIENRTAKTGSAVLGAYDEKGVVGKIGSASLIGKDEAIEVGDVVEVAYLYWTGVAMIQPRILHRRTDKTAVDCTFEQFPAYSRKAIR
jgi:ATP-dependent DNA ligase